MRELAALTALEGIGQPLGEPEAVWAVARGFSAAADTLDRAAKRVNASIATVERRGWSGKAAGSFGTRCREYAKQLTAASQTFREVVVALTTYAARLEGAQTMVHDARRSVLLAAGAAAAVPLPDLNWAWRQADMAIAEVRAASLVAATELRALADRATPAPSPVRRRPGPGAAAGAAMLEASTPPPPARPPPPPGVDRRPHRQGIEPAPPPVPAPGDGG